MPGSTPAPEPAPARPAGGRRQRDTGRRAVGVRWGRVLAANAVGVVLLLAALEIGVRALRPDITSAGADQRVLLDSAFVDAAGRTTGLRPGAQGTANGEAVRVDGGGFHVYAGNAGLDTASAWLWLGDSVLFGIGVATDSTVAGRLALAQDTARVLNPAVIGWGTADYRRRLDGALAAGLRPGRVTLVWCLNDADPGRPSAAGEVARLESARRQAKGWLNRHSRLYRLAKDAALDRPARYYAYDRTFYEPLAGAVPDGVAEPASATSRERPGGGRAPVERALTDLFAVADTLAARGIPFEVVVVPYLTQIQTGDRLPQRVLVPRLRAHGIPALDLADAFARAGRPESLYLWSDGIHLSARGHAVAARAIARAICPPAGPGLPCRPLAVAAGGVSGRVRTRSRGRPAGRPGRSTETASAARAPTPPPAASPRRTPPR